MTIIFIWESGIQTITKKLHRFEIHSALKPWWTPVPVLLENWNQAPQLGVAPALFDHWIVPSRLLLFCKRSRNGCGRLLRYWYEGDDGKVKGEMKSLSSFPSSPALPFTTLLSLILIGDWETTGDESGFDPNTPTQWRHLLLLLSLIFMHNP